MSSDIFAPFDTASLPIYGPAVPVSNNPPPASLPLGPQVGSSFTGAIPATATVQNYGWIALIAVALFLYTFGDD